MEKNELIVDEEYCEKLAQYFNSRGSHLELVIRQYINILERIEEKAIISGDVYNALLLYIDSCKKIQNNIGNISNAARRQTKQFVKEMADNDKLTF